MKPPSKRELGILFLAVVLLSMGTPLLKKLVMEGGAFGLTHPNAISFCNVLFVGNLIGGVVTFLLGAPHKIGRELKETSWSVRRDLMLASALAVIYPSLLFTALESTSVTNVTLLSRFEAVLFALSTAWLHKKPWQKGQLIGHAFVIIGVLALVLVGGEGALNRGDVLVLISGVFFVGAALLGRRLIDQVSLRTFVFFKNATSAVFFFFFAILLFGPEHFADAFHPDLWALMLIYASVVIVLGQLAWFRGVRSATPTMVANIDLLSPFLTIGFAFVFLAERPTLRQAVAIPIILLGMLVAGRGEMRSLSIDRSFTGG